MKKIIHLVKQKKLLAVIVGLLILAPIVYFGVTGNGALETVSISVENLTRTVKIAGKVTPLESADLGFETSGTIILANKKVGDTVVRGEVLASLSSEEIRANILKAQAELASAEAELSKLEGAGIYETKIDNAKRSLVQAMLDAYTAADDAIYNKTDQFFVDPRGAYPQVGYTFRGYTDLRESVNNRRREFEELFEDWKVGMSKLTVSTYTEAELNRTKDNLSKITLFVSDVSRIVNILETSDFLTQTTLDKYKSDVATARNSLNTASEGLINDESEFRDSIGNVPIQVARVEAARASILFYRSELSKSQIVSPINGIVSKQLAKTGQVATAGSEIVSVISRDSIIEAFIPEVSIGEVVLGNIARVTLDAYSDRETFEARVTHIDPAETIRDGVSTYKVELSFTDTNGLARSGMTANVEIETFSKPDARVLPERTVVREDGKIFVLVLTEDGKSEEREVTLGQRDSKGNIEIIGGLSSGENVILNP